MTNFTIISLVRTLLLGMRQSCIFIWSRGTNRPVVPGWLYLDCATHGRLSFRKSSWPGHMMHHAPQTNYNLLFYHTSCSLWHHTLHPSDRPKLLNHFLSESPNSKCLSAQTSRLSPLIIAIPTVFSSVNQRVVSTWDPRAHSAVLPFYIVGLLSRNNREGRLKAALPTTQSPSAVDPQTLIRNHLVPLP